MTAFTLCSIMCGLSHSLTQMIIGRIGQGRLVSSNAQIGEREAAWFPKLTLLGDLGFTAANPGHLIRGGSFTWVGAPLLQWNGRFSAQQNRISGDAELIKDYIALQKTLGLGWLHD
jgi:outer membrane protein TolC